MPQPPVPPTIQQLRRSPHWKALEPIFQTGFDDARRGHWDNHHPARSLRWYAYEAGHDEGDNQNQRELASQRKPS
jgi:hypothetical protein